jgi:hypothetical protein
MRAGPPGERTTDATGVRHGPKRWANRRKTSSIKYLDPTLDIVFKLMLVREPALLRDMIQAVLGPLVPIDALTVLNPGIEKELPSDKGIVLDALRATRRARQTRTVGPLLEGSNRRRTGSPCARGSDYEHGPSKETSRPYPANSSQWSWCVSSPIASGLMDCRAPSQSSPRSHGIEATAELAPRRRSSPRVPQSTNFAPVRQISLRADPRTLLTSPPRRVALKTSHFDRFPCEDPLFSPSRRYSGGLSEADLGHQHTNPGPPPILLLLARTPTRWPLPTVT